MSAGCVSVGGRETLVAGGSGLENFDRLGTANWSAQPDFIQATEGTGRSSFLITKASYEDFHLVVEFWPGDDANSGIFLRCQDRSFIDDTTCYEVNIFDQRPDPSFGTGSVVDVAAAAVPVPKVGSRWNTYEITVKGSHLRVVLNGVTTVDAVDARFRAGPIALQWGQGAHWQEGIEWGQGTIRFRKFEIQRLVSSAGSG